MYGGGNRCHTAIISLPYPPHGYRYVRVAQDVLFIAVRTSMVVNTVCDLNNM